MAVPRDDWPEWARQHYVHVDWDAWQPIKVRRVLSMRVLAVAVTRVEGAWCAYVDAVPGVNHELEQEAVLANGDKLDESVARALFPSFDFLPYST